MVRGAYEQPEQAGALSKLLRPCSVSTKAHRVIAAVLNTWQCLIGGSASAVAPATLRDQRQAMSCTLHPALAAAYVHPVEDAHTVAFTQPLHVMQARCPSAMCTCTAWCGMRTAARCPSP